MADREWFERLDALIAEIREALALNNAALERQDRNSADLRVFIRDQLTRFDRVIEDRDRQLGARLKEIFHEHRTEMAEMMGEIIERRDREHRVEMDGIIERRDREHRTRMDAIMERHFPSDGPATA